MNPLRRSFHATLSVIEPTDAAILDRLQKRTVRDGEERLMLAVLENATEDFQKYLLATHRRGIELFQAAEQWIFESDSPSLFSFESICEHLQLDAAYLRAGFMRWKAAKLSAQAKRAANSTNHHSS
jgi:hypothetical protein